jgi:hypothetical protein
MYSFVIASVTQQNSVRILFLRALGILQVLALFIESIALRTTGNEKSKSEDYKWRNRTLSTSN